MLYVQRSQCYRCTSTRPLHRLDLPALLCHCMSCLQMQEERNQALDRVNLLDMELTAAHSMRNTLQQRIAEVEATVVARERVRV